MSINAFIKTIARFSFLTPEQGSANSTSAATAKEVRQNAEKYKGKFLVPVGKVEIPSIVAEDDRLVKGLWENTIIEVNRKLIDGDLPPLETW